MGRLDGKVAVVTGSARGIGKQIALSFAGEGADIVVDDIRVEEMEATAREIRNLGRKAIAVRADVTKQREQGQSDQFGETGHGGVVIKSARDVPLMLH